MRFAALPVGAASTVLIPLRSRMEISSFNIVVFPVPGPPVIMHRFSFKAVFTAVSCISESPAFSRTSLTTEAMGMVLGVARESSIRR